MILKLLKLLGAGLRNGLVAIGALAFIGTIGAIADYALTQGSGTNFASKVISTVHYAAGLICDATAGESQCAAVDSNGALKTVGGVVDQTAFTYGTTAYTPGGCVYNSSITNLTSGQGGAFSCDNTRSLFVNSLTGSTFGAQSDAAWSGSGNASMVAALKAIYGAAITGSANNGSTYPAASIGIGTKDSSGNIQPIAGDPCLTGAKVNVPISQTANAQLVAGVSAKKIYVCNAVIVGADAENVSFVEGTGSVCATSTAAVIGGTTAAAGMNLAANSGWAQGNGMNSIAFTATAADALCLFQSGSGRVAGNIMVVQQ